ncbi:unnamed protein product, partial [Heterotrigona itama]
ALNFMVPNLKSWISTFRTSKFLTLKLLNNHNSIHENK